MIGVQVATKLPGGCQIASPVREYICVDVIVGAMEKLARLLSSFNGSKS